MTESSASDTGTGAAGSGAPGTGAADPAEGTKIPGPRAAHEPTAPDEPTEPKQKGSGGVLGFIERVGDRVPHPAIIFLILCAIVIVASQILYAAGVKATSEVAVAPPAPTQYVEEGGSINPGYNLDPAAPLAQDYHIQRETVPIAGLLTGDGVRFMFTSPIDNFNGFGVVGVILVAMFGVGVAEEAGLIGALIRKLVSRAPPITITFIIVLVGILSSIATDAGYLVLIPLGAAAFYSLGRNPMAGLAAAFAGVSAAFGVNVLIKPLDGLLTGITNEALHTVAPGKNINITANLYFSIAATIFLAIIITAYTDLILVRRLGKFTGDVEVAPVTTDKAAESRGLRWAGIGLLVCIGLLLLLTLPSWALLRNPQTGSLLEDSPLMEGLIFIISLVFLIVGLAYGRGAGTMKTSNDVMNAITKTFAGLAGLILTLLIIAQFIALFNHSNIGTVVAIQLSDVLQRASIGPLWLLVLFILVTFVVNLIIPAAVPKWAIFAPIFVPLFYRLGIGAQTLLAAYRIGDSPFNVVTPLMVYLPFIVIVAQRYKKDAGLGTVISLMIPYALILAVAWVLFFMAWYALGIPLGPGAPVKL